MEKMGGLLERSLVAGLYIFNKENTFDQILNVRLSINIYVYYVYLIIKGVTVTEVLLSHIVVQYIVLSVQTALMMLVLFVFFDNPMVGSLVWSLSLLFLTGTSGMCYGK